jgi:hypothetical protein
MTAELIFLLRAHGLTTARHDLASCDGVLCGHGFLDQIIQCPGRLHKLAHAHTGRAILFSCCPNTRRKILVTSHCRRSLRARRAQLQGSAAGKLAIICSDCDFQHRLIQAHLAAKVIVNGRRHWRGPCRRCHGCVWPRSPGQQTGARRLQIRAARVAPVESVPAEARGRIRYIAWDSLRRIDLNSLI